MKSHLQAAAQKAVFTIRDLVYIRTLTDVHFVNYFIINLYTFY